MAASISGPTLKGDDASRSVASASNATTATRTRSSAQANGSPARSRARRPAERLPRSVVLDRLREHSTKRGVVTAEWLQRNDPLVYRDVLAHFGGIASARRAAEVPVPRRGRQWSEARVINELRQLQRRGRVRFTAKALAAAGHQPLVEAIYKYVGSIARARRLARIPAPRSLPSGPRERWDDDRVIGEIRERHRSGEPLSSRTVPHGLLTAAVRHCGSWQQAIEMAGLSYDQIRLNRQWTRNDVLAAVKRAAALRARHPTGPAMHQLIGSAAAGAVARFFGGMKTALRAAGVDPLTVITRVPFGHRSRATLVAELRALVARRPGMTSRELFDTRLGKEAAARFGSRVAVVDAIGDDLWTGRRRLPLASAEEVIAGLRARHRQGHTMTVLATQRSDRRLVRAATKHYGTWRAAMEAAGLGHLVGCRTSRSTPGNDSNAVARSLQRPRRGGAPPS